MDENDFIFYVLHKSQGKSRIRNFFYWASGNDFQTLHQHLILVCGDLQRFLFCTGPSEVPVFNPLVQKEKSVSFLDKSFYAILTIRIIYSYRKDPAGTENV